MEYGMNENNINTVSVDPPTNTKGDGNGIQQQESTTEYKADEQPAPTTVPAPTQQRQVLPQSHHTDFSSIALPPYMHIIKSQHDSTEMVVKPSMMTCAKRFAPFMIVICFLALWGVFRFGIHIKEDVSFWDIWFLGAFGFLVFVFLVIMLNFTARSNAIEVRVSRNTHHSSSSPVGTAGPSVVVKYYRPFACGPSCCVKQIHAVADHVTEVCVNVRSTSLFNRRLLIVFKTRTGQEIIVGTNPLHAGAPAGTPSAFDCPLKCGGGEGFRLAQEEAQAWVGVLQACGNSHVQYGGVQKRCRGMKGLVF